MVGLDGLRIEHALVRVPAGEARGALVLLHGRGADEEDLLPLAEALDRGRRLCWALPRAPLRVGPGYAWYHMARVGEPIPETFVPALAALAEWLRGFAAERGVEPARTVLCGFSQGAVMAAALALARGLARPAAVLMLSGYLPRVAGADLDFGKAQGLPVFVQHGSHDPVIPVQLGRDAAAAWQQEGALVRYHEFPGGHHVDPQGLELAAAWLAEALGEAGAG